MAANEVLAPYEFFTEIDGEPLEAGLIYVGEEGLDAETNPITVYSDRALSDPLPQPLRTLNGYIIYNGTPANIYADADAYSMTVRNKNGTLIVTRASNQRAIPFSAITGVESAIIQIDSIADFIVSSLTVDNVEIISYYGGWENTVAGPKGGQQLHRTGATNNAPSAGTPVPVSHIGTGVQSGYYYDATGAEWRLSTPKKLTPYLFGARGDATTDDLPAFDSCKAYIQAFPKGSRPEMRIPASTFLLDGQFNVPDFVMIGEGSQDSLLLFNNTSGGDGYAMVIGNNFDDQVGFISIGLADPGSNNVLHGIHFFQAVQLHGRFKDIAVNFYDSTGAHAYKLSNIQDTLFDNVAAVGGYRGWDLDPVIGVNTNNVFLNCMSQALDEFNIYATGNCEQFTWIGGTFQNGPAFSDLVSLTNVDEFLFQGCFFESSNAIHREIQAENVLNLSFINSHFTSVGAQVLLSGFTNCTMVSTFFESVASVAGKVELDDTASLLLHSTSPDVTTLNAANTVQAHNFDFSRGDLKPGAGVYHVMGTNGEVFFTSRGAVSPKDATIEADKGIKLNTNAQTEIATYQQTPLITNVVAQRLKIREHRVDGVVEFAEFLSVGSPEGVAGYEAPPGSVCWNTSGGAGVTQYVKESGTGNTGWVAK